MFFIFVDLSQQQKFLTVNYSRTMVCMKIHNYTVLVMYHIAGKFSGENVWRIYYSKCLAEKILQMNRSAKGLLIATTTMNGFSLANCR